MALCNKQNKSHTPKRTKSRTELRNAVEEKKKRESENNASGTDKNAEPQDRPRAGEGERGISPRACFIPLVEFGNNSVTAGNSLPGRSRIG